MSKQEFLDRLRAALNGRVPAAVVTENINYYEDYINTEIRKGRSEAEVMDSLGDPRLIAKTIIQTSKAGADGYSGQTESSYAGRYDTGGSGYGEDMSSRGTRIPGWLIAILVILAVILIVSAVFSILSFLAPLIIVLAGVMLLVKVFRDWLN
ncbi:MAG: DUF1700 domain-containing protein [Lachnospiraceae bacterium]|nr:DUF1700 domain-containing protein [Lachnospiraceae bacterium]